MATWKKIIVSGSQAELAGITGSLLTDNRILFAQSGGAITSTDIVIGNNLVDFGNNSVSGSFSGSFSGDGSGLTGVTASSAFSLSESIGISPFTYNGSEAATVAISGAAELTDNTVVKWDITDGKFVDSAITDDGTDVSISTSGEISLTAPDGIYLNPGTSAVEVTGSLLVSGGVTGSFTGSFSGDGSQLTGVAATLGISGSAGTGSVDLKTQSLSILGTTNEIETSASGQTITIGLPNEVTIQDLNVTGDLVVLGTASFQSTTNLEVADRFVLLASGSNSAGDGGIIVQQATQDVGELFGFDSGTTRWGVTSSFTANQSDFTPDAFMASVIEGTNGSPTSVASRYQKKGNIFVGTDESIWIYS
jgi:hypothetical protein